MSLSRLPKTQLHLHLDCSLSYAVVSRIDPSISRSDYHAHFVPPPKCINLADVLTRAENSVRLMQTGEQLELVTQDLFDQLVQDHVIYAELRFAPLLHTEKGLAARDVVQIVEESVFERIAATGVEARILLCTLRHFSEEQSLRTVKLVESSRRDLVAGLDIASDEAGPPLDPHVAAFQYARAHGIPCTAHAGEAKGPESVWETLERLRPSRIGHGVRSIEDPALVAHLKRSQIHLEVCPTSNIMTNSYPTLAAHPIDELYQADLSVGINNDAYTLINTTLTQEYEILHRTFGWQREQFLQCNINALRAAFIPDQVRDMLSAQLMATQGAVVSDAAGGARA